MELLLPVIAQTLWFSRVPGHNAIRRCGSCRLVRLMRFREVNEEACRSDASLVRRGLRPGFQLPAYRGLLPLSLLLFNVLHAIMAIGPAGRLSSTVRTLPLGIAGHAEAILSPAKAPALTRPYLAFPLKNIFFFTTTLPPHDQRQYPPPAPLPHPAYCGTVRRPGDRARWK